MTSIRKDLVRMGSALRKVKNPMPSSETETKTETKSDYTTSPSTEQSNKVKSDFKMEKIEKLLK